jgi:predicted butyrate kinase (DUF1464 family)
MIIRAIGDTNFNGKFSCEFIDGEDVYTLKFDLEMWKSTQEHGLFNGNTYYVATPRELKLQFDTEIEVSIEDARTIYEILVINGWIPE